jgi:hypothetical protein
MSTRASQRLNDALAALASGQELTPEQRVELTEAGWADATPRQAQQELEEQARRAR